MARNRYMLALLIATIASTGVRADDKKFYLHVGPAALLLDSGAEIEMNGAIVPGASVRINDHGTLGVEVGYYFDPNWAISFTGGFPPSPSIYGKGSVAGVGRLGSIVYGPTALTAHYHYDGFGAFRPYVGGGAMFMFSFKSTSDQFHDMKVSGAIGAVGQVGAEYMFTDRLGLYFDVKKAYLRTNSSGTLYGTPASAQVRIDPLVLNGGVTFRF